MSAIYERKRSEAKPTRHIALVWPWFSHDLVHWTREFKVDQFLVEEKGPDLVNLGFRELVEDVGTSVPAELNARARALLRRRSVPKLEPAPVTLYKLCGATVLCDTTRLPCVARLCLRLEVEVPRRPRSNDSRGVRTDLCSSAS